MENARKQQLAALSTQARLLALEAVNTAKSGHLGGSFSIIDALTVLYFDTMRIDPANSKDPGRDRLVLSKGHASPALYSVLALRGFFETTELKKFRSIHHHLSGHVEMKHVNGVDMSTGSLGQGLSVAVGMALAGKLDHRDYRVYAVMGDGEIAEGQIWEAALAAAHYGLDNLCGLIDVNRLQIDGTTDAVLSTSPLDEKLRAFGWNVLTVDGHDHAAIADALSQAAATHGMPTMLLLNTVKGKGVSFMEDQVGWHGRAPSDDEYEQAKAELTRRLEELS